MLSLLQKKSYPDFKRGTHLAVTHDGTIIEGFFIKWQPKLHSPDEQLLFLSQDIECYKKHMESILKLKRITQSQYEQALKFKQYKKSCIRCLDAKKIISIDSKPFYS